MYVCLTSTHTGNTGSYLTDSGSVYITRDGGLTWEQVPYNKKLVQQKAFASSPYEVH